MTKFIVNPVTGEYESTAYTFRDRFALGGGVIQGEKVGDRENFGAPKTGKREELRNFFRSQPIGSEIERAAVLDNIVMLMI